jgi:transcription termination factor Rho
VYEEFKGTGNMELHLNRRLQERRVFPAFDVDRSSTRREELLLEPDVLSKVWTMRRMLAQMMAPPPMGAGMDTTNAMELLITRLGRTKTNTEFLASLRDDF